MHKFSCLRIFSKFTTIVGYMQTQNFLANFTDFSNPTFEYTESKTEINMDCYCFCVHVNVLCVKKVFSIFMHSQTLRGFFVDNLSFTGKEAFALFQDPYLM